MKLLFLVVLVCFYASCDLANAAGMPPYSNELSVEFSQDETRALQGYIHMLLERPNRWHWWNQGWDIGFKVVILLVALTSAAGAAYAASLSKDVNGQPEVASPRLRVINAATASAVALLSAFAFNTFDFQRRATVWEKKVSALEECALMLQYAQPSRVIFLSELSAINAWGDFNVLSELTSTCSRSVSKANSSALPSLAVRNSPARETGKAALRRVTK